MNAGEALIAVTVASGVLLALVRSCGTIRSTRISKRVTGPLSISTFLLVSIDLAFMLYLFMASDVSYLYVWSNTSAFLPTIYKISGLWAGGAGSFLLWTWFISLAMMLELWRLRRKALDDRFRSLVHLCISLVLAAFLVILLLMGPFAPTIATPADDYRLALYPNGLGLVMPLQTWEMVLHPVLALASYAFLTVVFAAAVAFLLAKERNWTAVSLPWTRASWLLLTLGIAVGSYWAYYVIGYGGYWSWDPIETSSLVLWLVVAATLHGQMRFERKGQMAIAAAALGMLSLASALFATFVTRAGGIWASSVHSYGTVNPQPAGERLLTVLGSPPILGIFVLMLVVLAITAWLLGSRRQKATVSSSSWNIDEPGAMTWAIGLLALTALFLVILMMINVDADQALNFDSFNQKVSVFAVALMVLMSVCMLLRRLGQKWALRTIVILAIVSALSALAAGILGASIVAGVALPSFLVATAVALYSLVGALRAGTSKGFASRLGPPLIHLGVALVLVAYIFSVNLGSVPPSGNPSPISVGASIDVGGFEVHLVSLQQENVSVPSGQYNQVRTATFEVLRGGSVLEPNVAIKNYYLVSGNESSKVGGDIHVYKTALEDLHMSFEWVTSTTVVAFLQVLPLMNVLWTGIVVLVSGIAVRTVFPPRPSGMQV